MQASRLGLDLADPGAALDTGGQRADASLTGRRPARAG
jgi:hypothetical protein